MTLEKETGIWMAFDKLSAKLGRTPSYEEVISELGSGSNSQIKIVRDKWLKRQERAKLAALDMPAAIKASIAQATNIIWMEARDLAAEKINAVASEAASTIASLEADNDYFLHQTIELEAKLQDCKAERNERRLESERAVGKAESLSHQVTELKVKLALLSNELSQRQKENTRLHEQVRKARLNVALADRDK